MMPQWVGIVLIFILATVVMWICSFLFSLLAWEERWEAIETANKVTAVGCCIAVLIGVAGTLFVWIYTASGFGS